MEGKTSGAAEAGTPREGTRPTAAERRGALGGFGLKCLAAKTSRTGSMNTGGATLRAGTRPTARAGKDVGGLRMFEATLPGGILDDFKPLR